MNYYCEWPDWECPNGVYRVVHWKKPSLSDADYNVYAELKPRDFPGDATALCRWHFYLVWLMLKPKSEVYPCKPPSLSQDWRS